VESPSWLGGIATLMFGRLFGTFGEIEDVLRRGGVVSRGPPLRTRPRRPRTARSRAVGVDIENLSDRSGFHLACSPELVSCDLPVGGVVHHLRLEIIDGDRR